LDCIYHSIFFGFYYSLILHFCFFFQEKCNVPKEILVIVGAFFLVLVIIFGVGIASLSSLVGFVYPAFKSFQAIETKKKGDDTQWLVYWVIFAFFSIMETFVDILLYWIPFYYAFKLAFLLWAMLPQTNGAKFLYENFLKDLLKKNESRIDAALNDAKKSAGTIVGEISGATAEAIGAAAAAAAGSGDKKDS
jgi:receptor expression-enhancing protein 5/6